MVAFTADSAQAVRAYAASHGLFFPIAADAAEALGILKQRSSWLPFSRMPGLVAVRGDGSLALQHTSRSPRDLPNFDEMIAAIL